MSQDSDSDMWRKIIRTLFILVFITCLILGVLAVQGQSEEMRTWSSPLLLGSGWWQSVAIDVQGNFHVAWYDGDEQARDFLVYRARAVEGTWTDIADVIYTGRGGLTIRNALAATSDGILHAAYRHTTFHRYAHAPISRAMTAPGWEEFTDITQNGYYLDMISDTDNILHLVTSEQPTVIDLASIEINPCALCYNLMYRRSLDGGKNWSEPTPVSVDPTTGADRPDVWFGETTGRIYINWDEGQDWYVGRGDAKGIGFIYSEDSGATWSDPIFLTGDSNDNSKPLQGAFTELRDGSIMAVWRYSTDSDLGIYYQISDDIGASWTPPQPVPELTARSVSNTPLDDYSVVTDHLGNVHLFVVGQTQPGSLLNQRLYHAEYGDNEWKQVETVFYSPEMRPEWPRAKVGPQNELHLTWFVRSLAEGDPRIDPIGLKVFYSHRESIFPEQATPTFIPTITPQPTSTPFVPFAPTATPFPDATPMSEVVRAETSDNYAGQTAIAGLFASAVFCGVIIFLVRALPRR
jgi:hypothetical protein